MQRRAFAAVSLLVALTVSAPVTSAQADDPVPVSTTVTLRLVDENRWPVRGIAVEPRDALWDDRGTTKADGTATVTFQIAQTQDVTLELRDDYGTGDAVSSWSKVVVKAVHPGEVRSAGTLTFRIQAKPWKASTAIKTSSRSAVKKAYRAQYKKQLKKEKPVKVKGCSVAKTPTAVQKRVLTSVNFVRSMAGVEEVTLDPKISARDSKAALIQYKQGWLDHYPSKKATCWSKAGAEESGSSNLSIGTLGAANVKAYMDDDGWDNTDAGHRGWLLAPPVSKIGVGYAGDYGALHVVNTGDGARWNLVATPSWTSWPSAGYFPKQLEPSGRWSFYTSRSDVSFTKAKVKVTVGKKTVKQKIVSRGDGLVFDLSKTPFSTAKKDKNKVVTAKVTVSGMVLRDSTTLPPYAYTVRFFTA